jgi:hypothetical protein
MNNTAHAFPTVDDVRGPMDIAFESAVDPSLHTRGDVRIARELLECGPLGRVPDRQCYWVARAWLDAAAYLRGAGERVTLEAIALRVAHAGTTWPSMQARGLLAKMKPANDAQTRVQAAYDRANPPRRNVQCQECGRWGDCIYCDRCAARDRRE